MNNPPSLIQKIVIYFFCIAVIIGPAYTTYDHYDFSHSIDTESYLKIAKGDFNVYEVHKYRIIIPFSAAAINAPLDWVYKTLWPDREMGQQGLMMAFLLVNTLITAFAGLFIFLTCLQYGASRFSATIGLLAFLTSSWTCYIAGLPLVDSLYILILALTVYGIKSESRLPLIIAILLGPFAKESFIFVAPLILFFGRQALKLNYQIILFLTSGILVFALRYYIDLITNKNVVNNLNEAFTHLEVIGYSIKRILSFRGLGELFRVWGIFTFILIIGFIGNKSARGNWIEKFDWFTPFFLLVVLIHMLLSGDVGRMMFLASPVVSTAIALIIDKHSFFQKAFNPFKNL